MSYDPYEQAFIRQAAADQRTVDYYNMGEQHKFLERIRQLIEQWRPAVQFAGDLMHLANQIALFIKQARGGRA